MGRPGQTSAAAPDGSYGSAFAGQELEHVKHPDAIGGFEEHVPAAGITIPRTSQAQWAFGQQIPASQVRPGNLVFFAGSDGTPAAPGHVGIVLDPATHTMIDAYATGYTVEEDTYGLPASKGGLSPAVGFTRPVGSQ